MCPIMPASGFIYSVLRRWRSHLLCAQCVCSSFLLPVLFFTLSLFFVFFQHKREPLLFFAAAATTTAFLFPLVQNVCGAVAIYMCHTHMCVCMPVFSDREIRANSIFNLHDSMEFNCKINQQISFVYVHIARKSPHNVFMCVTDDYDSYENDTHTHDKKRETRRRAEQNCNCHTDDLIDCPEIRSYDVVFGNLNIYSAVSAA